MILSPSAAVAAWRRSHYDAIEWDLAHRIGAISYPIVGGLGSTIGGWCNWAARPFKVGWAFVSGRSPGLKDVELTEIPADLADTQYGEALRTLRGALRQRSDASILKWTKFLKLEIGESYRQEALENHLTAKIDRGLIMPEDHGLGNVGKAGSQRGNTPGFAG